jgi:hypothetical protein
MASWVNRLDGEEVPPPLAPGSISRPAPEHSERLRLLDYHQRGDRQAADFGFQRRQA